MKKSLFLSGVFFFTIAFSAIGLSNTKTQTLFSFERVNYKPYKILFYDIVINDACELAGDLFDPHYIDTKKNKRVEIKNTAYFTAKNVEVVSPNHIRFTFKALENVLSGDPTIDTFVFRDSKRGSCNSLALLSTQGGLVNIKTIKAEMRVILGKVLGVKRASAIVNNVSVRNESNYDFEVSDEDKSLCLYGEECR